MLHKSKLGAALSESACKAMTQSRLLLIKDGLVLPRSRDDTDRRGNTTDYSKSDGLRKIIEKFQTNCLIYVSVNKK